MIEGSGESDYLPYKIDIADNKVQNVGTESRLYIVNQGQTDEEREAENQAIIKSYQLFKNRPDACFVLQFLRVHQVTLQKNAINKGSGGGIKLLNVKGQRFQESNYDAVDLLMQKGIGYPEAVCIRQNLISDVADGVGILVDASTVIFDQNQIKKCQTGMLLQSSQTYQTDNMLQQIDDFGLVTIEMGTLHFNTGSGI